MLILLAVTDRSFTLGNFERVAYRLPHVARYASLQVMDPDSQLLSGFSNDQLMLTKIGMYRIVTPTLIGDVTDAMSMIRHQRRGATVAVGCGELYEALLPFAQRVVHFRVNHDNYHNPFDGGCGEFPDLSDAKFTSAWKVVRVVEHDEETVGTPTFTEIHYESTGIPHFELEHPPGYTDNFNRAPLADLRGIIDN